MPAHRVSSTPHPPGVAAPLPHPSRTRSTPASPPSCAYGITKAAGVHWCRLYRLRHGVRASAGILYNHESPLRRREFVSQRIVRGAVDLVRAGPTRLVLGDLSARVDWGWGGGHGGRAWSGSCGARRPANSSSRGSRASRSSSWSRRSSGARCLDPPRHVVEDPSLTRPRPALRRQPGRNCMR